MLKTLLFLSVLLLSKSSFGQIHYYSDCIKGGAVGDGYTAWWSGGISTVQLPVPVGSTIKKAIFFSNIYKWEGNNIPAVNKMIEINGMPLILSESDNLENTFYFSNNNFVISTISLDITDYINPLISNYSINPLNTGSLPTPIPPIFSEFYILVLFENPTFNISCIDVFVNDINTNPDLTYNLSSSNAIDILSDAGLAIHAGSICDNSDDWYEVLINSTSIGNIGGEEDNTTAYCAGTIGSFNYENGILSGIGNDNGDTPMNGLDAVANIQPIINGNENFNVTFDYVSNFSPYSNVINQLFLTYSTTCDTFSVTTSPDTTICFGETLQLYATGGQIYEWLPSTGLSCSDCPDPIFTADSSMFYTIRIWNNDSCSVVRPIKINVSRSQIDSLSLSPPDCGASNGSITVYAQNTLNESLSYSINGASIGSATISGLIEGSYIIGVQDGMGCPMVDSTVFLSSVNTTISQFGLDPSTGNVPLEISTFNLCQNATDYTWYINGVYSGNDFDGFTIEDGGEYLFELVAWQYDPSCADTFSRIVWASEIIIPTAFTPNEDLNNDFWELVNLDAHFPKNKVQVFNRLGNLIFESIEGKYSSNPWDGKYNGEALPIGSYYFIIDPNDGVTEVLKGVVSVVLDTF